MDEELDNFAIGHHKLGNKVNVVVTITTQFFRCSGVRAETAIQLETQNELVLAFHSRLTL
jgi:hypothetical protein